MSTRLIEIHGELFVTLETAAECYHVEERWIEQVCRHGALGPARRVGGSLAMPVSELDRLAAILRWNRHHGLELEAVVALLAE